MKAYEKPIMSIAYHKAEKDVAISFQRMLEFALRGQIIIHKIEFDPWEREKNLPAYVAEAIKSSRALIIFASPDSCQTNILSALIGVTWGYNVPSFFVCHSGLVPQGLPFPLNNFLAVKANDFNSINSLFAPLGEALGIATPRVNSADFIHNVEISEHGHQFWATCNKIFSFIQERDERAIEELREQRQAVINMSENDAQLFESWLPFLEDQHLLRMEQMGYVALKRQGIFRSYTLFPMASLGNILKNTKLLVS